MMMRTLDARPLALLGALIAGSAVTLGVMAVAGSSPAIWVAVAGASACACGVVVGSTARVLPAAVLAGAAGAALVLAAGSGGDDAAVEVRRYVAPPVVANVPTGEAAAGETTASETAARTAGEGAAPSPTTAADTKPAPAPLTAPQFVRRFYKALDAGRFTRAWKRLGPAVRARSVSFEAWRSGYATTVSQRVEHLRVEPGDRVRHTLVTVDRTPCGTTTERRFEMLWYLQRDGRAFTARDLVGVQLAGVAPDLACG